jgi:hypothetical protein
LAKAKTLGKKQEADSKMNHKPIKKIVREGIAHKELKDWAQAFPQAIEWVKRDSGK